MSAAPAAMHAPRLRCVDLSVTVGERVLLDRLSIEAAPGTVTCVLGCNGAGKTLTLHTLAGLRAPAHGSVLYDEQPLDHWQRKVLARRLGLLTQLTEDPFPSTVIETVLIGRHPHIDFWRWESDVDKALARKALEAVDLASFAARDITTLSGGERRRVALAALLAQDPEVFLLDEPINHLDPHHQIDVLRLMRGLADSGRAVVMSLHDPSLAARFSDQALLLFGDGRWECGPAKEVLNETAMSQLFSMPMKEITWPGGRSFVPA